MKNQIIKKLSNKILNPKKDNEEEKILTDENKPKKKMNFFFTCLLFVFGTPILTLLLVFIIALLPFATVCFVFYQIYLYKTEKHRLEVKLKYKTETLKKNNTWQL